MKCNIPQLAIKTKEIIEIVCSQGPFPIVVNAI